MLHNLSLLVPCQARQTKSGKHDSPRTGCTFPTGTATGIGPAVVPDSPSPATRGAPQPAWYPTGEPAPGRALALPGPGLAHEDHRAEYHHSSPTTPAVVAVPWTTLATAPKDTAVDSPPGDSTGKSPGGAAVHGLEVVHAPGTVSSSGWSSGWRVSFVLAFLSCLSACVSAPVLSDLCSVV